MHVTVSDPQQHEVGTRQEYTTYNVSVYSTSFVSIEMPTAEFFVRRRYSDFQWLYERLQKERPGTIIPIIPHKRALTKETRFSKELIAQRRQNLEVFLQAIVHHVELEEAPSLTTFLKVQAGEAFDAAKQALNSSSSSGVPNKSPSNHSSDNDAAMDTMMGGMETTSLTGSNVENGASITTNKPPGTKIRNFLSRTAVRAAVSVGDMDLVTTEDEPEIERIQQFVEAMDLHVKALIQDVSSYLIKSTSFQVTGLHHLGQVVFSWSMAHQSHTYPSSSNVDSSSYIDQFARISSTCSELTTMAKHKASEEESALEQALQDMQRVIQAIKIALQKRKDKQVRYTANLTQIESRKTTLDKVRRSSNLNKQTKITAAENELGAAEHAAHVALKELQVVTKRLLREMDRIQPILNQALCDAIHNYGKIQISYSHKMGDAWTNLVPQLSPTKAAEAEQQPPSPPSDAFPKTLGQPEQLLPEPPLPQEEEEDLLILSPPKSEDASKDLLVLDVKQDEEVVEPVVRTPPSQPPPPPPPPSSDDNQEVDDNSDVVEEHVAVVTEKPEDKEEDVKKPEDKEEDVKSEEGADDDFQDAAEEDVPAPVSETSDDENHGGGNDKQENGDMEKKNGGNKEEDDLKKDHETPIEDTSSGEEVSDWERC